MLSAEQMRVLKKLNISNDKEKTKERIANDFKTTTSANKAEIVALSGLKRPTFYRVFDTGAATARVILSMSQVLNVSPFYYTADMDEKEDLTDDVLISFLEEHKYDQLVKELKSPAVKRKRRQNVRKSKIELEMRPEEEATSENGLETETVEPCGFEPSGHQLVEDGIALFSVSLNSSQKMQAAIDGLDAESAELLLKALFKRAEAGEAAKTLCDLVKRCLLS